MENDNNLRPTNEEIIEELTKDLQKQKIPEAESPSETNFTPEEFEDEDSANGLHTDTSKPDICDDFIDEEELKKINENLTAEEKEERIQKANELKKEGNDYFKNSEYLESIKRYSDALRLYPLENMIERSIVYSNRAASKIYLNYKESAIDDCSKSIELNANYVRALLRRAKLYEETEKFDESLEDYKKVIELDPGNKDAVVACQRLPPIINERNEKMKTEMFGKLKDLGNMILKPFGLSTNNFNLQQDPSTGSYSVNFQQNSN